MPSIPAPILPQSQNGIIDFDMIIQEDGLVVRIPRYSGAARSDVISVFINDTLIDLIILNSGDDLPQNIVTKQAYKINELNTVFYGFMEASQNEHVSPIVSFTIIDDSDISITLTTTSGAIANGSATNQATVYIEQKNNPASGKTVLLTIIGQASFINGQNTISIVTDMNGKGTVSFSSLVPGDVTIRATCGIKTKESVSSFVSEQLWPVLTSNVLNNEEPYGTPIQIQYELLDSNGQGVGPTVLTLSSQSSTISFLQRDILIDNSGKAIGQVNSSVSGEFNIIASVSYPAVRTNNTTVTFKEKSNYYISAEIVQDGAIANGADYNIIYFTVYDSNTDTPVKNQMLYVEFTGPVHHPVSITTSANGFAILTVTSEDSGSFEGTVVLASDPDVTYSFITKFTNDVNDYPKFMGNQTVWFNGYMPISDFLSNYNLTFGHVYTIEFSRFRTAVYNCNPNYVFDKTKNGCVTTYANNIQFYNTELTHFRVLASGVGSLFHSQRYYYYNSANIGYGTVSVWDYGYSPMSADEQPLPSLTDGEENSNREDTEPFNDE